MTTLASGFVGGLTGGVVARAWMRLVAKSPEFTWSGTLAITLGFAIFGLTQAGVFAAREHAIKPITISAARILGSIGMLPLFLAAGAQMLPTVIGGGLAVARIDWRHRARTVAVVIALAPVVLVTRTFFHDFGWSPRSTAGTVGLVAIYTTIISATRSTLAPHPNGICKSRKAKFVVTAAVAIAAAVPLLIGGVR